MTKNAVIRCCGGLGWPGKGLNPRWLCYARCPHRPAEESEATPGRGTVHTDHSFHLLSALDVYW